MESKHSRLEQFTYHSMQQAEVYLLNSESLELEEKNDEGWEKDVEDLGE